MVIGDYMIEYSYPVRNAMPDIFELKEMPNEIWVGDHLNGFNANKTNPVFDFIAKHGHRATVHYCQVIDEVVQARYPTLDFKLKLFNPIWMSFGEYCNPPPVDFKNFICTFNGSNHLSRQFLTSALYKFNWWNTEYCSKNFAVDKDSIDGSLQQYCDRETEPVYRKFILDETADDFYNSERGFGFVRWDHGNNIHNLAPKLTQSFVHIASETVGHSYYPFVTEKFLYSVVTKGLFVTYGQPGWHSHVEKYYGFKPYRRLFNYNFDTIENPVERLIELLCMLSKFSVLTRDEWHDLYNLEKDTIEFNYNHYYSKDYLKVLNG